MPSFHRPGQAGRKEGLFGLFRGCGRRGSRKLQVLADLQTIRVIEVVLFRQVFHGDAVPARDRGQRLSSGDHVRA
ncbi:MAG TPA: hypothetical protein VFV75_09710 [Candidatus Polarisedimenticolaceae bacterium]|nr:hypothetical protein [Candidatus Polarisedimenticolaceae bacterium]